MIKVVGTAVVLGDAVPGHFFLRHGFTPMIGEFLRSNSDQLADRRFAVAVVDDVIASSTANGSLPMNWCAVLMACPRPFGDFCLT